MFNNPRSHRKYFAYVFGKECSLPFYDMHYTGTFIHWQPQEKVYDSKSRTRIQIDHDKIGINEKKKQFFLYTVDEIGLEKEKWWIETWNLWKGGNDVS